MSIFILIMAIVALLMIGVTISSAQSPRGPSKEETERRVASILEQMTLLEKIDYIGGVDRFYIRSIPRLGIPRFKMADGPLGVRNYGPSTAMAGGIALAASWDVALAERVGEEIGRDARARGVHFLLGPGVNIYRAPMNGRNFEYFGEDPFLASAIAVGYINGVQDQGVCATIKHFIGNNSEFDRRKSDAIIEERALREIYLPTFESAVKDARVGSIMTSYNLTNGFYMSQNGHLNNDIVKDEWGFDGIIMSDWTSTFDGVAAANGGLDLEMPSGLFMNRHNLLSAIEQGTVLPETIDDKVRRIMRTAVRFGWLDRDQTDASVPRYNRKGCEVALDASRGSMVLLKNEGKTLPLQREHIKSIAVIGPNAHPSVVVGGGSALVDPFNAVSFLEGITGALSDAEVYYHPGIPGPEDIADAVHFYTAPFDGSRGMQVEYFNNVELSGDPVRTCVERQVGAGERASETPEPFSSSRWTGYFIPPDPGDYEIFMQIPGEKISYRLYLDDRLIMDAWNNSKSLLETTRLALTSDPHKVVLELARSGEGFAGGKLRLGIVQVEKLVDPAAIEMARKSEVVVLAVGFNTETESESGDRTFRLPVGQDALIKEIAAANQNTVVAITSGGSVDMTGWIEDIPAVIETWYPGQEGGTALAEILLGDTNPSGRLPVSFEIKWEDNPTFENYYPQNGTDRIEYREGIFVGYRGYEQKNVAPLFPFGHGLSYTTFKYSNLDIKPFAAGEEKGLASEGGFEISFDVKNTGDRDGAEVAQLYVGSSGQEVERPPKELKGFVKINLRSGETGRVTIRLDRRAFSFYDVLEKAWRAEPGDREVLVGASSDRIELCGQVTLSAMEGK